MDRAENEDIAIEHVVDRLTEKFPDVEPEVVEETVAEIHGSFEDAHVRDFVPVIVEHEAAAKLREADAGAAGGTNAADAAGVDAGGAAGRPD